VYAVICVSYNGRDFGRLRPAITRYLTTCLVRSQGTCAVGEALFKHADRDESGKTYEGEMLWQTESPLCQRTTPGLTYSVEAVCASKPVSGTPRKVLALARIASSFLQGYQSVTQDMVYRDKRCCNLLLFVCNSDKSC
jgi:hypothetical protein